MPAIVERFEAFDEITKQVDGIIDAVAKEVYVRIYNRTPVDTGFAQSRWVLTRGKEDFVVSNDAPYISYLENGHSGQAPMGMVAVTMNEIDRIVEQESKRLIK